MLGQLAVEERSDEITAVLQLLDMLDVSGLYHEGKRYELLERHCERSIREMG